MTKMMTKQNISAIIVAAGSSTRMGEGIDKQMIMLGGLPVLGRSMLALERCDSVGEIIVVTKSERLFDVEAIAREFGFSKLSQVVSGGETRQQSVAKGIACANPDAGYYLIHDGARPLVSNETVQNVVAMAVLHGAAAAAVPVKDTIKQAGEDMRVQRTLDRGSLYQIQTPQVFEAVRYRQALARAEHEGLSLTDDCQLFERMGYPVYLARGDYQNIKLTTLEDIAVARAFLGSGEDDWK